MLPTDFIRRIPQTVVVGIPAVDLLAVNKGNWIQYQMVVEVRFVQMAGHHHLIPIPPQPLC